jgi:cathepsin L
MDNAFTYIKENIGIGILPTYTYKGVQGTCRSTPCNVGAIDTGYVNLPYADEAALMAAVATIGPISVAIDASGWAFQLYSSGIYNNLSCSSIYLNHGVLVVGYGSTNGQDYWIVKNSWGMSWGMSGYILMPRNANNYCGIASYALYPTV